MKKSPLLLAALLTAAAPLHLPAATVYWDGNDTATGAGETPNGTWLTNVWSTDPNGEATPAGWTAGDIAVFSAGADATGAYSVTGSGTSGSPGVIAAGVIIEEGTVTFSSGTLGLGAGFITINAGATLVTDSSLRISTTAGSVLTLNGGTAISTNSSTAGSFVDIDFTITLAAAGGTLSHTAPGILNIVQTSTIISGPGSLTKTGAGVLAIASPSTYTGATIVNEGELRIRTAANRLPITTAVTVNSPGILNLNGVNQQIGSLSGDGLVGLANATLTVGDSTSTTYGSSIRDTANAGANGSTATGGKLTKIGTGTLSLGGANTYTGVTTVNGGILNFLNTSAKAPADVTANAAGSIGLGVGGAGFYSSVDVDSLFANTLAGFAMNAASGVGIDTSAGNFTYATSQSAARALTKLGANTLTLSGANTYTGSTTVSGGTLQFARQTSLYNNTSASWTAPNIIVNSGATLALNVGGTDEFTTTDVTTLLTNLTPAITNNGLRAGSAIGFDTTNAAGGNFTIADVIADSTGTGGGAVGLAKLGTNTLVLTGANTYSGVTRIHSGTLELSGGANRLPTGTSLELGGSSIAGTLRLNGNNQTIARLTTAGGTAAAGSRVVNGSATPATFTVNLASGSDIYEGKFGGPGGDENNLVVTKQGGGTLVLTNQNTHTGGTVIAGGKVQLGASRTIPVSSAIWLDATDGATITTSVDGVTSWTNKGTLGAAGDATAAFGEEPALVAAEPAMNNQPVIRFDASFGVGAPFDRLTNAQNFKASNVTVMYVGRLTGASNERLLAGVNNNWLLGPYAGNSEAAFFNNGFLFNGTAADPFPRVYTGTIATSGAASFYVNGASRGSGVGAQGPDGLSLGGGFNDAPGTEFSAGDIGEMLVFNSVLSGDDRRAMEAYLARKWQGVGSSNILPVAGAVSLTIAGATLDVNGVTQTIGALSGVAGTSILLNGGSLTAGAATVESYAGAIAGDGLFTKAGSGTLTLTGPLSMTTLTASAGTLNVSSPVGTGASTINANATTNIDASQTLAALNIGTVPVVALGTGPEGASLGSAVVPEPGSFVLLALGAAGLLGRRRVRRRDAATRDLLSR